MRENRVRLSFELSRSTRTYTLASGNEMISANDRMHHMNKSALARHLREKGLNSVIEKRITQDIVQFTPDNPCHIIVTVRPPTKRQMDAPNWYPTVKPLVDGMTDAELFSDDNDAVVSSMTFIRGPQTDNKKYEFIVDIRPGLLGGIHFG